VEIEIEVASLKKMHPEVRRALKKPIERIPSKIVHETKFCRVGNTAMPMEEIFGSRMCRNVVPSVEASEGKSLGNISGIEAGTGHGNVRAIKGMFNQAAAPPTPRNDGRHNTAH